MGLLYFFNNLDEITLLDYYFEKLVHS